MHLAVDLVDQGRILPVYGWGQYGKISIGWRALPKYHELLFIKEIAQSMPGLSAPSRLSPFLVTRKGLD